jgi:3-oxoacyl-[acyl-carrier protein] reductase
MELGIRGKAALVSGGSQGVGRALALGLAREGARVAVVARKKEPLDRVVDEVRALGGEAVSVRADMADPEGIADAVRSATEAFGPPAIAVANVEAPMTAPALAAGDADYYKAQENLYLSVLRLARHVLPPMADAGWGRFVVLGSMAAKAPHRGHMTTVSAARAAATSLVRSLAVEYADRGVVANTILIGYARTPTLEQYAVDLNTTVQSFAANVPLGRVAEPEAVADVALFLCSGPAAYLTGQAILVDGGCVPTVF